MDFRYFDSPSYWYTNGLSRAILFTGRKTGMKIKDIFTQKPRVLSFELFPPKRDGDLEELFTVVDRLKGLGPAYISITYGAGGSIRVNPFTIANRLKGTELCPYI